MPRASIRPCHGRAVLLTVIVHEDAAATAKLCDALSGIDDLIKTARLFFLPPGSMSRPFLHLPLSGGGLRGPPFLLWTNQTHF